MKKSIDFIASDKDIEIFEKPTPSSKKIPDWYKSVKPTNFKNFEFDNETGLVTNLNVKSCAPFLDSLTSGYTISLHSDLAFRIENGNLKYYFSANPIPITVREEPSFPIPDTFYNTEFVWKLHWLPKTPKNYSVLITHPFNRFDLPFHTFSGIIDSDLFYHTPSGSIPFYLKKDFEGIIEAGTPILQILPFKRDDWKSNFTEYDEVGIRKRKLLSLSRFRGLYKEVLHRKKKYN